MYIERLYVYRYTSSLGHRWPCLHGHALLLLRRLCLGQVLQGYVSLYIV